MTVRCVIIDDSHEFIASATRLLASQGLEVIGCASSSDSALHLVRTHLPDVALVDIQLGEEDGIALSHELVARAPSTRVVLISSYDQDELGELIARSGAVGFLPKTELGATAIVRLVA